MIPISARLLCFATLLAIFCQTLKAQHRVLEFSPAHAEVSWTLDASMHTVHGSFDLKRGSVRVDPGTGLVNGEIVLDATSGKSGNDKRDRKMHKDVLESSRFPEIVFRPTHVDGKISPDGPSTLQVHGTFSIHGTDHAMTVPMQVIMTPSAWTVDTRFNVPYVEWGMKNPSNFVLRVASQVEIKVHASGTP